MNENMKQERELWFYMQEPTGAPEKLFILNIPANATQSTDKRQQLHLTKNKTEIQHDMHATARQAFFSA